MPTMKQQFDEFHDKVPGVYDVFVSFADEARKAGISRIRALEVMHRVLWEFRVSGQGAFDLSELKVMYANRYAMELMTRDHSYAGFFDLTIAY